MPRDFRNKIEKNQNQHVEAFFFQSRISRESYSEEPLIHALLPCDGLT